MIQLIATKIFSKEASYGVLMDKGSKVIKRVISGLKDLLLRGQRRSNFETVSNYVKFVLELKLFSFSIKRRMNPSSKNAYLVSLISIKCVVSFGCFENCSISKINHFY